MSIIIEQDIAALSASASFFQRAELNAVCLVSARIQRHLDWENLEQPIHVEFEFEPRDATVADGQAEIRTNFQFRATDSRPSHQEALLVECTFQATYEMDPEYVPEQSELIAFQSGNAIFNAWPYFREFVQTNVARMNLPVPPVPFLRVIQTAGSDQTADSGNVAGADQKVDGDGEKHDAPVAMESKARKRRNKK